MKKRRKKKKRAGRNLGICLLLMMTAGLLFFAGVGKVSVKKAGVVKNNRSMPGPETEWTDETVRNLNAGTIIDKNKLDLEEPSGYFTISEIDEKTADDITGKSYTSNDNIQLDELRYLKILHYNYDHEIQVGELIVNAKIAKDCKDIFLELFLEEYEIESMYLIDKYWTGDSVDSDTNSIEHNNTSAFNYRVVPGTKKLSNHAAGFAIDINPMQNPYVKYNSDGSYAKYYKNMEEYTDRSSGKAHMITPEDTCYKIFTKYGFTWGGDWNSSKDYQHFEKRVD